MTTPIKNPILHDVPTAFETERLVIRAPQPEEGAVLNAAILDSLEELKPWMPWVHPAPSVEDSEIHARHAHAKFLMREELYWRLWLKASGDLIGCSGLHRINWSIPKFEIGFWCRTQYSGQGYISEAVRGITRMAFENLDAQRVEIQCDARNERSRRVMERCNFTHEGRLRRDTIAPDGSLRDTLVFSLLREEFQNLADAWPPITVL
jgi:RimJ/RimL family protein N-acetyltransferase